jgi:hypothetical protein
MVGVRIHKIIEKKKKERNNLTRREGLEVAPSL